MDDTYEMYECELSDGSDKRMKHAEPWYRDAIIYAIDVEKFADSNGDGIGDFGGLLEHIDYLDYLGVTCVWLLPFYVSPRRDNGYDVEDHYRIDPRLGTLSDFLLFVHAAGERGIRVIVDIVMDHTSDEHPWFEAARRDRRSRYREYYTWVDIPPRGGLGHGSAFPGEEYSLWKYDEVAGQYYYHPFYRFQPQLNMGHPEVRRELMRLLDYWLSMGISGFRLDAVPLMLGLDGPAVKPPRDPHSILQEARDMLETRKRDSLMMGEVDLSPAHLSAYFGEGDELNCMLNFILNNYLFLGFAKETADPIIRGLRLLPLPPPRCQWVNFLRNLDELNIQWLPEEDRHFVWDAFAPDMDMRIYNRGIRRRLAPMLGDPAKVEMAMSLLLALPGTPMMVYGDEIGMGERLDLRGRDAARCPMQWNKRAGGGFSSAPVDKLVRPLVDDGEFSYKKRNVETEMADESSLLNAVRRLIMARRSCPEIGRGTWHELETQAREILAYQCVWRTGLVVLVHNLSGHAATEILDLSDHCRDVLKPLVVKGAVIEELGGEKVKVDLEPYGYTWFRLIQGAEIRA